MGEPKVGRPEARSIVSALRALIRSSGRRVAFFAIVDGASSRNAAGNGSRAAKFGQDVAQVAKDLFTLRQNQPGTYEEVKAAFVKNSGGIMSKVAVVLLAMLTFVGISCRDHTWDKDRRSAPATAPVSVDDDYKQSNGVFDDLVGWTRVMVGSAKGFRRVYAMQQMDAPDGVSGQWMEELTNKTVSPNTTTESPLSETVIVKDKAGNAVVCAATTGTLTTAEDSIRIIFKGADGTVLVEADYSDSAHYIAAEKKIGFVVSADMWTMSRPGTTQPYGWFGRNGSFNLRTDAIDGTLGQTVFYFPTSRFASLSGLHLAGPSTGTLTSNLTPLDMTARSLAEVQHDPTLRGVVDGKVIRHIERLSPDDYNLIPVNLPELGAVSRLQTKDDPYEVTDPDNANLRALAFHLEQGHIRPKGTTFAGVLLRPATLILTIGPDDAGRESRVLGKTNTGEFIDVTMDFPMSAFKDFDPSIIEIRLTGSNPTDHPEVKDRLIVIPKKKGETSVNVDVPSTLGTGLTIETMIVKVQPALTGLEISPPKVTMERGAAFTPKVTKRFADGSPLEGMEDVVANLDDPAGGTLNKQTGGVTAGETLGTYVVTYTTKGASATFTYVVDENVESLTLEPQNFADLVGEEVPLKTTLRYTTGATADGSKRVKLVVSEETKAEVVSSEKIKIKAKGSFTVKAVVIARTGEKESNTANGVGKDRFNPASFTLEGPTDVFVGQTLDYNVKDQSGNNVDNRYPPASSNGALLAMGALGQALAKAPGTVEVNVPGTPLKKSVTIRQVDTITLAPNPINGTVGQTGTVVTVNIRTADGFVSTDSTQGVFTIVEEKDQAGNATSGVATIIPSGALSLLKIGTAKVKFTAGGKEGFSSITVSPPPGVLKAYQGTTLFTGGNLTTAAPVLLTFKVAQGTAEVDPQNLSVTGTNVDLTGSGNTTRTVSRIVGSSGTGSVVVKEPGALDLTITFTIISDERLIATPASLPQMFTGGQATTLVVSKQVGSNPAEPAPGITVAVTGPITYAKDESDPQAIKVVITPSQTQSGDVTVTISLLGFPNLVKAGNVKPVPAEFLMPTGDIALLAAPGQTPTPIPGQVRYNNGTVRDATTAEKRVKTSTPADGSIFSVDQNAMTLSGVKAGSGSIEVEAVVEGVTLPAVSRSVVVTTNPASAQMTSPTVPSGKTYILAKAGTTIQFAAQGANSDSTTFTEPSRFDKTATGGGSFNESTGLLTLPTAAAIVKVKWTIKGTQISTAEIEVRVFEGHGAFGGASAMMNIVKAEAANLNPGTTLKIVSSVFGPTWIPARDMTLVTSIDGTEVYILELPANSIAVGSVVEFAVSVDMAKFVPDATTSYPDQIPNGVGGAQFRLTAK